MRFAAADLRVATGWRHASHATPTPSAAADWNVISIEKKYNIRFGCTRTNSRSPNKGRRTHTHTPSRWKFVAVCVVSGAAAVACVFLDSRKRARTITRFYRCCLMCECVCVWRFGSMRAQCARRRRQLSFRVIRCKAAASVTPVLCCDHLLLVYFAAADVGLYQNNSDHSSNSPTPTCRRKTSMATR